MREASRNCLTGKKTTILQLPTRGGGGKGTCGFAPHHASTVTSGLVTKCALRVRDHSSMFRRTKKKVSACACQWKTTQILLEDVLHVLHVHAHLHKEATRAFSEDCREGVLAHLNASTRKLGAELSRDDVRGIVDKLTGRTIVAPIATPGRMNYLFEFMGCAHTLMHVATCDMKNVSLRAQAHAGATSTSRDILASFIATHPCNLLRYFYTK